MERYLVNLFFINLSAHTKIHFVYQITLSHKFYKMFHQKLSPTPISFTGGINMKQTFSDEALIE